MNDRSRTLTAACVGAALGGLWGWLYLTDSGGALRGRIGLAVDRFTGDIKKARAAADRARAALLDARSALIDAGALAGHA
jgi:hypothetical protein